MLNNLFQISPDPVFIILMIAGFLMVLAVHEAAHAYVANLLGDDTAKLAGRLTLNPFAHLDPIGTVMLLLFGFGWGKPVPINPYKLRDYRRDSALIALAGPASNFVLALILAVAFHLSGGDSGILVLLVQLSVMLGIFNLLPFGPFDGFKVVAGLLPVNLARDWEQTSSLGLIVLLFLILTPAFTNVVGAPVTFVSKLLLGF